MSIKEVKEKKRMKEKYMFRAVIGKGRKHDCPMQTTFACRQDVVDLWNVHVEPEDTSDIWHNFWVPQECQHCQV